ncbi:MAG: acyl-CoA thioesterase [Bacteroidia bacterium]|nr:acyl-CoA thioesterase [Sphingobacteriaceae bacterium]MBP9070466.1 acyl-CoA thioesterase [Bacteroidia bacterium]
MITFEDYKHSIAIQIRFSDIDKINHVNNACYLNYFETARVNYFDLVFKGRNDWAKLGFVLARNEINHLHPLHLEDQIFCYTKITELGNKSMTIKNCILKKTTDGLIECANGIGILVAMNYVTRESILIPEDWKKMITEFEK